MSGFLSIGIAIDIVVRDGRSLMLPDDYGRLALPVHVEDVHTFASSSIN